MARIIIGGIAFVLLAGVISAVLSVALVSWSSRRTERLSEKDISCMYWHIEMVNMQTGLCVGKNFRRQIILGRTVDRFEPQDRLFLGNYETISRNQCIVEEVRQGLRIKNLSNVNLTKRNGYLLQSEPLAQGDYLDMGAYNYYIYCLQHLL